MTTGLETNHPRKLKFIDTEDKGRGVAADEDIAKGEFVVEYKYSASYPPNEKPDRDKEYEINDEGSYVLEVQLPPPNGWMCLDATRNVNSWGRYINHSPSPNLKKFAPVYVKGKWRVAFTALDDIKKGEELLYDYGHQRNPPQWMKGRKKRKVSCNII